MGGSKDVVGELELQRAGEVLDRGDVREDLGDALVEEPLEGVVDRDEIGEVEDLGEIGEGQTFADARRGTATPQTDGRATKIRELAEVERGAKTRLGS